MSFKMFNEMKDVIYCVVISVLLSVIVAISVPADIYKIINSDLISGLVLLVAGSLVIPRLIERSRARRKKAATLDGMNILALMVERKLDNLVKVIGCACHNGRYQPIPVSLSDKSGCLSYWLIPDAAGYDAYERDLFCKLNNFLDAAHEEIRALNAILLRRDEQNMEIELQRGAARAALYSVYFIYEARSFLYKHGIVDLEAYSEGLTDGNRENAVSLIVSKLPRLKNNEEFVSIKNAILGYKDMIKVGPEIPHDGMTDSE